MCPTKLEPEPILRRRAPRGITRQHEGEYIPLGSLTPFVRGGPVVGGQPREQ